MTEEERDDCLFEIRDSLRKLLLFGEVGVFNWCKECKKFFPNSMPHNCVDGTRTLTTIR